MQLAALWGLLAMTLMSNWRTVLGNDVVGLARRLLSYLPPIIATREWDLAAPNLGEIETLGVL